MKWSYVFHQDVIVIYMTFADVIASHLIFPGVSERRQTLKFTLWLSTQLEYSVDRNVSSQQQVQFCIWPYFGLISHKPKVALTGNPISSVTALHCYYQQSVKEGLYRAFSPLFTASGDVVVKKKKISMCPRKEWATICFIFCSPKYFQLERLSSPVAPDW